MRWKELKAHLISVGSVRLLGEPAVTYVSRSAAGPGAGGEGAVFFSIGSCRVRLDVDPTSPISITHLGDGNAEIKVDGESISGRLERVALHCPRQAYITVTGSCVYRCRYCGVPEIGGKRKSIGEIVGMVKSVIDRIDAISITSGVLHSAEEEEEYVLKVIENLRTFNIPIGVSIYPTEATPENLAALGVVEVKFNIEAATESLFAEMCPGLDYSLIWHVLERSVGLFGRNHVFSNVIVGLEETDEEMEACINRLTGIGVIPVLRPLSPAAALSDYERPSPERLLKLYEIHKEALCRAGLDPSQAQSMCVACSGCDLVPWRDE
jgi:biotin synthase-related radical SAM superfamily protein